MLAPARVSLPPLPGLLPALGGSAAGPAPFQEPARTSRASGAAPAVHPLAEPLYWASVELLTLASRLDPGALAEHTSADMRRILAELFAGMDQRARAAGIAPEDVQDATYAIMALFDEILVQTPWPGQSDWRAQSLQFRHFHENTAGENFFARANALLQQPHRAHVLTIFFFCLALGFQGRYAMNGGAQLTAFYELVGAAVGHVVPPSEAIGPHAHPPDDERRLLQREKPIVRLALAFFGATLLLFVILRVALASRLSHAEQPRWMTSRMALEWGRLSYVGLASRSPSSSPSCSTASSGRSAGFLGAALMTRKFVP